MHLKKSSYWSKNNVQTVGWDNHTVMQPGHGGPGYAEIVYEYDANGFPVEVFSPYEPLKVVIWE